MTLQPRIEELKKLHERSAKGEIGNLIYFKALRNAFPAIVEALEQRWIPVSERLPEHDMGCIAAMERSGRKFVDVADYFVDGGWQRAGCTVTHWQPLPAPPTTKASAT